MARYIDAEELINNLNKFAFESFNALINSLILKQPTADVQEVKHGKWIIQNDRQDWKDAKSYMIFIECSECGKSHFLGTNGCANSFNCEELRRLGNSADYNYCGKCGAKMDKE